MYQYQYSRVQSMFTNQYLSFLTGFNLEKENYYVTEIYRIGYNSFEYDSSVVKSRQIELFDEHGVMHKFVPYKGGLSVFTVDFEANFNYSVMSIYSPKIEKYYSHISFKLFPEILQWHINHTNFINLNITCTTRDEFYIENALESDDSKFDGKIPRWLTMNDTESMLFVDDKKLETNFDYHFKIVSDLLYFDLNTTRLSKERFEKKVTLKVLA